MHPLPAESHQSPLLSLSLSLFQIPSCSSSPSSIHHFIYLLYLRSAHGPRIYSGFSRFLKPPSVWLLVKRKRDSGGFSFQVDLDYSC